MTDQDCQVPDLPQEKDEMLWGAPKYVGRCIYEAPTLAKDRSVCATCSDNGHNCLGYAESLGHQKRDSESSVDGSKSGEINTKPSSRNPSVSPQPSTRFASPPSYERPPLPQLLSTDSSHNSGYSSQSSGHRLRMDSEPRSPGTLQTTSAGPRNRVPYFRYFGPTAIVPGFKQMVVQMRGDNRSCSYPCVSGGEWGLSSQDPYMSVCGFCGGWQGVSCWCPPVVPSSYADPQMFGSEEIFCTASTPNMPESATQEALHQWWQ